MGTIYPYFRFEGYSTAWKEQAWKVVTLENPYITVLIAPEIGGKILGAFERSTGQPFLYTNNVVKFREIAMRGPWTSGGIEFNFGDIGHAPSTATPVDYTVRTNPMAASRVSLAQWTSIRGPSGGSRSAFRKDKAFFETHSFWYNPTSQPNVTVSLDEWRRTCGQDLQFVYPGTAYIDHGGNVFDYPIGPGGRDISRYANNAFASTNRITSWEGARTSSERTTPKRIWGDALVTLRRQARQEDLAVVPGEGRRDLDNRC